MRKNIDKYLQLCCSLNSQFDKKLIFKTEPNLPILTYPKADPYERHNIAALEPEVLEGMLGRLVPELRRYVLPHNPPLSKLGDPNNFGGFWSPGWC